MATILTAPEECTARIPGPSDSLPSESRFVFEDFSAVRTLSMVATRTRCLGRTSELPRELDGNWLDYKPVKVGQWKCQIAIPCEREMDSQVQKNRQSDDAFPKQILQLRTLRHLSGLGIAKWFSERRSAARGRKGCLENILRIVMST